MTRNNRRNRQPAVRRNRRRRNNNNNANRRMVVMQPVNRQPRQQRQRRNRNRPNNGRRSMPRDMFTTQGNNVTGYGRVLRAAGMLGGAYFGNPAAGYGLGAGISRIFGQGDYKVTQNSLMNGGPPAFAALNTGIRMAHREYISDVTSTINFNDTSYLIDPSNPAMFPWLSSIAFNFESYRFRGLVFYFNTTCGDAISSTNNALGVVGFTTVYDPTDPPPASKQEAEDYAGCVSGVPSRDLLHPVECAPRSQVLERLYVKANSVVTNAEDLKFYALGKLNVFTQGMQAAGVTIGELWVSYDIEFYNPKKLPLGTTLLAAARLSSTAVSLSATNFINVGAFTTYGNIPITVQDSTHLTFGPCAIGYYELALQSQSSTAYTGNIGVTYPSLNVVPITMFSTTTTANASSTSSDPEPAISSTNKSYVFAFYKSDANSFQIGINQAAAATGAATVDIILNKLPNSMIAGQSAFSAEHEEDAHMESWFKRRIAGRVIMHGDDVIVQNLPAEPVDCSEANDVRLALQALMSKPEMITQVTKLVSLEMGKHRGVDASSFDTLE